MLTTPLKAFPEGTWYPEERMDSKEGKCTNQQAGHAPECIKEIRVFIPVMMGGMGQIACEFPVGSRVALLAGFYHVTPVQAGFTVVCRENIMGSVTVGAFSCLFTTGKH